MNDLTACGQAKVLRRLSESVVEAKPDSSSGCVPSRMINLTEYLGKGLGRQRRPMSWEGLRSQQEIPVMGR